LAERQVTCGIQRDLGHVITSGFTFHNRIRKLCLLATLVCAPITRNMWTEQRLFSALLAALLVVSMAAKEELKEATQRPPVAVSTNSITNSTNNSTTNSTSTHSGVLLSGLNVDSMMIQRALYVLIGSTLLGVLYMLVRAVR